MKIKVTPNTQPLFFFLIAVCAVYLALFIQTDSIAVGILYGIGIVFSFAALVISVTEHKPRHYLEK